MRNFWGGWRWSGQVRKVIEYGREAGVADTGAVMRCSSSVCFVSWPAIMAAKEGAHAGWEEGLRWPIHALPR